MRPQSGSGKRLQGASISVSLLMSRALPPASSSLSIAHNGSFSQMLLQTLCCMASSLGTYLTTALCGPWSLICLLRVPIKFCLLHPCSSSFFSILRLRFSFRPRCSEIPQQLFLPSLCISFLSTKAHNTARVGMHSSCEGEL